MLNLFHRRRLFQVVLPISGKCIPLEEVNDEVFSKKMVGEGFAVIPDQDADTVLAPISGEIVALPDTYHAFGIADQEKGIELLVHIGLNTVSLAGKGFHPLKSVGEHISAGDPVIKFDHHLMTDSKLDMSTMVIFTKGYQQAINLGTLSETHVVAGTPILRE